MLIECTPEWHAVYKRLGWLLNLRPWPEFRCRIGECGICKSTLVIKDAVARVAA